jgi:hypothetical protein
MERASRQPGPMARPIDGRNSCRPVQTITPVD